MRNRKTLFAAALGLTLWARAAAAQDHASLQLTVPAPDPVTAGEELSIQALAVNTGSSTWSPGSYYWVAEVYDLEEKLVARTDQVSPAVSVAFGDLASISLPFFVPATLSGRKLYRIFLIKDAKTLIASEFKPFQIVEKPIPKRPEYVDYRVEGNITMSYKNSTRNSFKKHQGATTLNAVGKIKESSYLLNAYILHETGNVFDPFILVVNYYAPWGTIYGGDVSPSLTPLSINGQSFRGAMLEQQKDGWDWSVLGGQSVDSEPGSRTTNGRYARSIYGGKLGRELLETVHVDVNYFLSSDEPGSLSNNPDSPEYRGPSLEPQKNSGYGLGVAWQPRKKLSLSAAVQKNTYFRDSAAAGTADTAWRGDFKWGRDWFKWKTTVLRAGPDFVAFGSPAIIGDRMSYDNSFNFFPTDAYTIGLVLNQYRDNLDDDSSKTTTTQRLIAMNHGLQLRNGLGLGAAFSLNTAKGKPAEALDNKTTTFGFNASKAFGRHSASLSTQMSQFRDNNRLADDLDTLTVSLTGNLGLSRGWRTSAGLTRSETKDKRDGSKRSSLSFSPSLSIPRLHPGWSGQFWGTYSTTQNTSNALPADTSTLSVNSECTWAKSKQLNWTFGVGYNKVDDKYSTALRYSEATVSTRMSYSF